MTEYGIVDDDLKTKRTDHVHLSQEGLPAQLAGEPQPSSGSGRHSREEMQDREAVIISVRTKRYVRT